MGELNTVADNKVGVVDKASKKKDAAEIPYILAKALKTQEPAMFLGREVLLKTITYTDDLIIRSIVLDVFNEAQKSGLEGPVLDQVLQTANILATVKMFAYEADGKSLVYKTMEDINAAIRDPKVFAAISNLFILYVDTMDLTMAEKKS